MYRGIARGPLLPLHLLDLKFTRCFQPSLLKFFGRSCCPHFPRRREIFKALQDRSESKKCRIYVLIFHGVGPNVTGRRRHPISPTQFPAGDRKEQKERKGNLWGEMTTRLSSISSPPPPPSSISIYFFYMRRIWDCTLLMQWMDTKGTYEA